MPPVSVCWREEKTRSTLAERRNPEPPPQRAHRLPETPTAPPPQVHIRPYVNFRCGIGWDL